MDKKAIMAYDITMWIIKIILLGVVVGFVMFTVYLLVVDNIGVERLRADLFFERMIASHNCLAYYNEEIDRVYPGTIDAARFNNDIIKNCQKYAQNADDQKKKFMAAKITITYLEPQGKPPDVKYYNQKEYDEWLPFVFEQKFYFRAQRQNYVFIHQNNELLRGIIQMDIITPVG